MDLYINSYFYIEIQKIGRGMSDMSKEYIFEHLKNS